MLPSPTPVGRLNRVTRTSWIEDFTWLLRFWLPANGQAEPATKLEDYIEARFTEPVRSPMLLSLTATADWLMSHAPALRSDGFFTPSNQPTWVSEALIAALADAAMNTHPMDLPEFPGYPVERILATARSYRANATAMEKNTPQGGFPTVRSRMTGPQEPASFAAPRSLGFYDLKDVVLVK